MASRNILVRLTITWSGGDLGLVGRLVGSLVLARTMVGPWVLVTVATGVTSSKASLRSRTWLGGVQQVRHPCCMQGEFLRQVFCNSGRGVSGVLAAPVSESCGRGADSISVDDRRVP